MSIPISKLVKLAKKRESGQGGKQLEKKTFFAKDLGKNGRTATGFCIPPSIKARLLSGIRSDLKSKAASFKASKDEGKKATHLQSMAKRIATANRLMFNVRTCNSKNDKDLKKEIGLVIDKMSDDDILNAIDEMKEEEMKIKKVAKEERESKLIEEGKDPSLPSLNQFIKNLYQRTGEGLMWVAYDGLKEDVDKPPISPCGVKINLGKGTDTIQNALDKLSFYGSKDDWIKYYVEGDTSHINNNGTFEPLSKNDWAGCLFDIYEDELQLTPQDIDNIAIDLKIDRAIFDYDKMVKEGYRK